MGIFGFSWADGGAFVGGALGAAFLGPPGAMLGSAVGSFAGAAWGDDKGSGAAFEEALVAGIGAAGGAWATNLAGKLLKDGIASAAAKALPAGVARGVDRVAAKALLPWNAHGGGPVAALGGAFGGYEVSTQARLPVQIVTTDIGNGGCPAQMANLRMPADLAGPVGGMYRGLPGYLCDVWRSFGTGERSAPPAPKLPGEVSGAEVAGIPDYRAKADRLNTVTAGFAELDRKAVALIAQDAGRISDEGRMAVTALIETVNTRAAEAPPTGASGPAHALDLLNDAFGRGREILSQAVTSSDRAAGEIRTLTGELTDLRKEFEAYRDKHQNEHEREEQSRPRSVPLPAPIPPSEPVPPKLIPSPAPPCPRPVPPPHTRGNMDAGVLQGRRPSAPVSAGQPIAPAKPPETRTIPSGGAAVSTAAVPTPWTRQAAVERATVDEVPQRPRPALPESPAEPLALSPVGRAVPSYVPAAWSGPVSAGIPGSAGSSGQVAAAISARTPWTGIGGPAVPAPALVPATPAGVLGVYPHRASRIELSRTGDAGSGQRGPMNSV
ncbi:hypothetical protein [Nocardia sp. NBC_01329]|uniref:hypothetical protein n=1 Tax=Nocardia sp. NBC_01329 TaxID=2903594 RepID=UPI002E140A7E|nr:hypothetical protein OG405_19095 [Nocardia sp. NBC_01329]